MRDVWEREKIIDSDVLSLVNMFLEKDPNNRPSINYLLNHYIIYANKFDQYTYLKSN